MPDKKSSPHTISRRSRVGLNAANFFLAEITGVVMPFLGAFLKGRRWSETAIGPAISCAGLGVFLMQTPAGMIVDRVRQRRKLLAGASILLGVCYGLLPVVPTHPSWVDPLLFVAGTGQAFFLPLLGALALGLVGHAALNRTVGGNQGWNHAGNLAAALLAMGLVSLFGVTAVFLAVPIISALAAASVFLIRKDEIDENRASGAAAGGGKGAGLHELLKNRRVLILLASTALFHLANAPVMPFLGAYIKKLGGSNVQVAAVVLVAQAVMIPVALAADWLCDCWGRKWVFGIGLVALPVRIVLYALTQDPWMLVALQAFDGIGAGVYGVVIVAICADLTKGKGGFNALSGMIATALAVGGVIGPHGTGFLVHPAEARAGLEMTIRDVAAHLNVGWDLVKDIQKRDLSRRYAQPKLKHLRRIAIDEIAVAKGHRYMTIVMDLDSGAVVFVGDGKGADALKPFWKRLRPSGAKIEAVAMDLSAAYRQAVSSHRKQAVIVFDHFHVIKLFNDKLSDLRRSLYHQAEADQKKVLKGSRWLLLKNPENLDADKNEKQRLEEALALHQPLATAYSMKEDLRRFWEQAGKRFATAFLDDWRRRAEASGVKMLQQMAKTLAAHRSGLLAYYDAMITSGPMEGTNHKIKTMKRMAYGFRDLEFFKLKILAIHETKYALVG